MLILKKLLWSINGYYLTYNVIETWPETLHTKLSINDSYHYMVFNRNICIRQAATYYEIAKLWETMEEERETVGQEAPSLGPSKD